MKQLRTEARDHGLVVSWHRRGEGEATREHLTVRTTRDATTKEDEERIMHNIRIVFERVLQIFAAAGEDMSKLTLTPYAKYRGRRDEDAFCSEVRFGVENPLWFRSSCVFKLILAGCIS